MGVMLATIYNFISIHAPPRGATEDFGAFISMILFQFTPLREGRRGSSSPMVLMFPFQFTPLREGRQLCVRFGQCSKHFNSRPSARGDEEVLRKAIACLTISIHAPPRGATGYQALMPLFFGISIHAPPRGATTYRNFLSRNRYFNSRPSARGDRKRYAISANLLFNPYKSAWLNNSATQFVEIILVIFHRIIA